MKKNKGLVSIIVACYNIDKYVERVMNSIKNQTYKNIEVLMVDDGSIDDTSKLLNNFAKEDRRFIYLYKKNGGLSDARNFGLKHACGEYICFIDGDDYIESDYIELLYKSIIDNKSDISECYFNRVYEDRISINTIQKEKYNLIKYPAAWNKMYKKIFFDKLKFKKSVWYEDLNLFGKILLSNPKISIVEKSLYNYIQNSTSIMHTYDKRIFQIYDVIEDIEKYANDNDLYNENRDLLEYINVYHILIGTIYRQSFCKDFNKKHVIEICDYVSSKYKNWINNKYIKELSIFYRVYLHFLNYKLYGVITIVLKLFNKKVNL